MVAVRDDSTITLRGGKMLEKRILDDGDTICYLKDGKLHREDGPAYVTGSGYAEYWINGVMTREDGPAYINDGVVEFWLDGKKFHNEHDHYRTVRKRKLQGILFLGTAYNNV